MSNSKKEMKGQKLFLLVFLVFTGKLLLGQVGIAGPDKVYCDNTPAVMLTPDSGFLTYIWSPSTGLSDSTVQNPIASPSRTTTYTLRAIDGANLYVDEVTVHFGNSNTVNIVGANEPDTSVCNYTNVLFTTDFGDSTVWHDLLTDQYFTNDTMELTVIGNHQIYMTVENGNGCRGRDYINVSNIGPELDVNAVGGSCSAGTADVEVIETSGLNAPYSILWSDGDTTFVRDSIPMGLYGYSVTDSLGCTTVGDIELLNNISNIAVNVQDELCAGDSVRVVIDGDGNGMYTYQHDAYTVGTSSSFFTSSTTYPSVFGNYYRSARHQILYKANELTAVGMTAGPITEIGFDLAIVNRSNKFCNFQIALQHTNLAEVSDTMLPVGTVVKYPETVFLDLEWNRFQFDIPFYWDGVSDLLLDVCYDKTSVTNPGNSLCNEVFSANSPTYYTNTSYLSVIYTRSDVTPQCDQSGYGSRSYHRPNTRFYSSQVIDTVAIDLISWSNTSSLSDSTVLNPFISPDSTDWYQFTIMDDEGCIYKDSFTLHVSDLVAQVTADPAMLPCGVTEVDLVANVSSTYQIMDYSWSGLYGMSQTTTTPTNMGQLFTNSDSALVELVVTDAFGCLSNSSVMVYRDPNCLKTISGFIFDDRDSNCLYDNYDVPIPGVLVVAGSDQYVYTDVNGFYYLNSYSIGYVSLDITMPNGYHNTCNIDLSPTLPVDTSISPFRLDDISFTNDTIFVNSIVTPALMDVRVFPDPANSVLNIRTDRLISTVEVVDLTGRSILRSTESSMNLKVSTSDFAIGSYILIVTDRSGNTSAQKFSVVH